MSGSKLQTILAVILIIGFASADAAQSRIYKTVDEAGNVVFTDIPPKEDESGEQIVVEQPNSFVVEEALGPEDQWIVEPDGEEDEPAFSYKSLAISSPKNDESIRENSGNVSVVVEANPRLQPGHRIRLLIDGQALQDSRVTAFDLQNIDRGTHTLVLEIIDDAGTVLIRSQPSTFHMLRHHLPPPRPAG